MPEWPKGHDWKSCVPKGTEGSNPSLSSPEIRCLNGERRRIHFAGASGGAGGTERANASECPPIEKPHDWKSCVPKGTEGSNPSLSSPEPKVRPEPRHDGRATQGE